jgi:HK97 family phage portal protein
VNLSQLLTKLPFVSGAVRSLADEKARQTVNQLVSFPPNDPYRLFREESYKTETKRDFLELYEKHIWYYSSVYAISSSLAQIPLRLYALDRKGQRQGEVLDGVFYNLINRPNPFETYYDFIENLVSYLELTGDTYIEKNHPTAPTQLYVLRPDFVEVKTSAKNLVEEYLYKPDGVPLARFSPKEIIHVRYFHPRSEVYGFSFTQASVQSAILDFEAIKFQKKFFKQGGAIDKYITIKKELSPEEYKRFKQEVLAEYSGTENAHKPMVLDNDGKLAAIGVDFDKVMLKEQRDLNRDEIFSGAGVPPIMANLLAGKETYNNAQTQEKAFWQNTIIPKARKVESKFNVELFWPIGFEVAFDFSGIVALQEDQLKKAQTAQTLVQGGIMTADEVRSTLYGMPGLPEDYVPPAPPSTSFQASVNNIAKAAVSKVKTQQAKRQLLDLLEKNEEEIWKGLKPWFKEVSSKLTTKLKSIQKAAMPEIATVLDAETLALVDTLIEENTKASARTLDSTYKRITGRPLSEDQQTTLKGKVKDSIEDWAEESADSIVETMSKRTTLFLDRAFKNDMSMEDMTEGIQDIFEGDDREEYPWARMIARTEATKVTNSANLDAITEAGFNAKTWIAGGGPNGRDDHTAMDGVTIAINEDFVLPSGVKMAYPGDPNADVSELANCRCGIIEGEMA